MKTDELIAVLGADPEPGQTPLARFVRAMAPALIVPLLAVVVIWQLRPDLGAALASPALGKTLAPAAVAGLALWLGLSLARPGAAAQSQRRLVLGIGVIALILLAWQVARLGMSQTIASLDTTNTLTCLVSVPLFALLPLGASLWALRSGATTHSGWAGAAAGLFSGGIAAAIYSLHCPVDTLVFFLAIYSLPIVAMTALGAVLGPRFLRW